MMLHISSNASRLHNWQILELLTIRRPYRITVSVLWRDRSQLLTGWCAAAVRSAVRARHGGSYRGRLGRCG